VAVSQAAARDSGDPQQHREAAAAIPDKMTPATRTTVIKRLNFWGRRFKKSPFSRTFSCHTLARLSISKERERDEEFVYNLCHHLADISQASAAFGVFPSAITSPGFLFTRNSRENRGAPIIDVILFDLFFRVLEAVADQIIALDVMPFGAK
jgi:hypothetical protein